MILHYPNLSPRSLSYSETLAVAFVDSGESDMALSDRLWEYWRTTERAHNDPSIRASVCVAESLCWARAITEHVSTPVEPF